MKKIMKIMSGLLLVLSVISLSNSNSAQAQDAALCNALFTGDRCDVSQYGNCAVMCFPQKK